jgi:uncharacterized protein (TIGR03435 family)
MTMHDLIQAAYPYRTGQKIVGPGWIDSNETRYNITAKAPGPASLKEMRAMLGRRPRSQ